MYTIATIFIILLMIEVLMLGAFTVLIAAASLVWMVRKAWE